MTIPSKIQSYMATGKPIISMLNGVGNKIIKDSDCGYAANAGDYGNLAENVLEAYHSPKEILFQKGKNGRAFYDREFEKEAIIDRLMAICGDESDLNLK